MQWGDTADPVTSASYNLSFTYSNNRITNTGFGYDADGRQTGGPGFAYYDAAGRDVNDGVGHAYDGDGLETKRETSNDIPNGSYTDTDTTTTYIVRSSVLGGKTITEHSTTEHMDGYTSDSSSSSRYKSYIYADGSEIAYDIHALSYYGGYLDNVYFQHSDSSGMSYKTSYSDGTVAFGSVAREDSPMELDGMGRNVGTFKPSSYETAYFPLHHINNDSPRAVEPGNLCPTVDYMEAPCGQGKFLLETGLGSIDARYNDLDLFGFGIVRIPIIGKNRVTIQGEAPDSGEDEVIGFHYTFLGGETDCEKKLAITFSHETDMIFSDVLDGDANDTVAYRDSGPIYPNGTGETHNHLYNPITNPTRATNIYAPAGGQILDSGKDSAGQNFITVLYKNFGSARDVVLQIFHVEGFDPKKSNNQGDGSMLLGHMGSNGSIRYILSRTPLEKEDGFHIHINAMQKWWKGRYVKGRTARFIELKDRKQVPMSSFCNK